MTESSDPVNRRIFLGKSVAAIAGGVVLPRTAMSYENIVGANDRISLGHIGIGNRGGDLDLIASKLKSSHRVEMTAVCDLWKGNREKAVATNAGYYGRAPRAVQHLEDLLAMKDIDGVLISTPEHSHSPILKMAEVGLHRCEGGECDLVEGQVFGGAGGAGFPGKKELAVTVGIAALFQFLSQLPRHRRVS